jgi:hypothetical protein
MNQYTGMRATDGTAKVFRNGAPLSPARSLRLEYKSPSGFEWGYCGSGPAQLALGILLEEFDERTALRYYQAFKREVVASFGAKWAIDSISIMSVIGRFEMGGESACLGDDDDS